MKKRFFVIFGLLALVLGANGNLIKLSAEVGKVATTELNPSHITQIWGTDSVLTEEGIKVTAPGADTKGADAWTA